MIDYISSSPAVDSTNQKQVIQCWKNKQMLETQQWKGLSKLTMWFKRVQKKRLASDALPIPILSIPSIMAEWKV